MMVQRGAAGPSRMDSDPKLPALQQTLTDRRTPLLPLPDVERQVWEDLFSEPLKDESSRSEDSDLDFAKDDAAGRIAGLGNVWEVWMGSHFPDVVTAMTDLTHRLASKRKAAVFALLKATGSAARGEMGDQHVRAVTNALAGRLGDDSASVRKAAVRGLAGINGRGNRCLVLAMADLAEEDTSVTVRTAAIQALTHIADRGDEEALAPVLKVLLRVEGHERGDHFTPHLSPGLSRHAVRAVGSLADRGHRVALQALCARVADDPDSSVREAAARSLGNIAAAKDRCAVSALMLGLEDRDEAVRRAAQRSLRAMIRQERENQDHDRTAGPLSAARSVPEPPQWGASRLWLLPDACDC